MPTNQSIDVFLRTLKEQFADFRDELERLLQKLTGNNIDEKTAAAAKTLEAALRLQKTLAPADHPPWLSPVMESLNRHGGSLRNEPHSHLLNKAIALQYLAIQNHAWAFSDANSTAFDFDALFEIYREQSRIPQLFDELVGVLEKIATSPEIDSRKVERALRRLIDTLKRNRHGSYFSTLASWDFVVGLFRNWLWEELCKLPALGGLLTALQKTLKETDEEMAKLHVTMQNEVHLQVSTEVVVLAYDHRGLPGLPFVEITEEPGTLEIGGTRQGVAVPETMRESSSEPSGTRGSKA